MSAGCSTSAVDGIKRFSLSEESTWTVSVWLKNRGNATFLILYITFTSFQCCKRNAYRKKNYFKFLCLRIWRYFLRIRSSGSGVKNWSLQKQIWAKYFWTQFFTFEPFLGQRDLSSYPWPDLIERFGHIPAHSSSSIRGRIGRSNIVADWPRLAVVDWPIRNAVVLISHGFFRYAETISFQLEKLDAKREIILVERIDYRSVELSFASSTRIPSDFKTNKNRWKHFFATKTIEQQTVCSVFVFSSFVDFPRVPGERTIHCRFPMHNTPSVYTGHLYGQVRYFCNP